LAKNIEALGLKRSLAFSGSCLKEGWYPLWQIVTSLACIRGLGQPLSHIFCKSKKSPSKMGLASTGFVT